MKLPSHDFESCASASSATAASYFNLGDLHLLVNLCKILFMDNESPILRKENRMRDDIRTNLIESYDRLMAFVEKHLLDKFYLEKDQRISIRF